MIAHMAYPQWNQPQGYYPPVFQPPRPTNGMAIAALICSLVIAPLGIVFGHIALSQIRRTGEEGRGMAVAGLVIGYVFTVIGLLFLVFWIVMFVVFANSIDSELHSTTTTYGTYSMAAPAWTALSG